MSSEAAAAPQPRVTVVGKPGCHLCDEAVIVVEAVCGELAVSWQELSILDDPELGDLYWDQIPVILVDGRQHDFYRVDPTRLRARLTG